MGTQLPKRDPTGRSWTEIAKRLNIQPNVIWWNRSKNPGALMFIYSYDPTSFENGYRMYMDDSAETKMKLRELYGELERVRKVFAFSVFLYESGVYTHPHTFSSTMAQTAYSHNMNGKINYKDMKRFKRIISLYKKFKGKL